jgi:hypothetical protein
MSDIPSGNERNKEAGGKEEKRGARSRTIHSERV